MKWHENHPGSQISARWPIDGPLMAHHRSGSSTHREATQNARNITFPGIGLVRALYLSRAGGALRAFFEFLELTSKFA